MSKQKMKEWCFDQNVQCVIIIIRQSKFFKERKARGLLRNFTGEKNNNSKWFPHSKFFIANIYITIEIVNNLLLAGNSLWLKWI